MPELSTIGISASLVLSLTSLILVVLMLTGNLGGDSKAAVQLASSAQCRSYSYYQCSQDSDCHWPNSNVEDHGCYKKKSSSSSWS